MNKLIAATVALAATAATAIPAQAQVVLNYGERVRVIETYCDRNPRDRDCWGYRDGRWGRSDYNRFYDTRRNDLNSVAAGIFGLAAGAIIGGAIANSNNRSQDVLVGPVRGDVNVAACQARYRSYDVATNTFLGYDGVRKPCNL